MAVSQSTARRRQVLAVEHDPGLLGALSGRIAAARNVPRFAGDVLSFPLPLTTFKVFASISIFGTSRTRVGGAPVHER